MTCDIDPRTDALFVHMLAERFAAVLKEWLEPWEWEDMQRTNATLRYKGDTICASHNHCDANMAMADAFESVMGREAVFGEETPDMEAAQQFDLDLINPAWSIAKRLYLTGE